MSNATDNTALPSSFRYRNVLEKGKPVHDKNDSFSIKHPAMDLSRRAKIFNPFDALKGFGDELSKAQADVTDTFLDETDPIEETP
ncbi:MAG: hypothetical protein K6E63_11080 [Lachnospiraceae bacterium]|nr:hypothetical protein [Lachnospiraceae bacterium]